MNSEILTILDLLKKQTSINMKSKNIIRPRGLTFNTKYGYARIISYEGLNSHYEHIVKILFLNTNNISDVSFNKLKHGNVKDYCAKTILGIGHLGNDYKKLYKEDPILVSNMRKRWAHMLERCYDKKSNRYYAYGAIGTKVSDNWLCFTSYYNDVINYLEFDRDLVLSGKLQLDKDKYQQDKKIKVYSDKTCCWLNRNEQIQLSDMTNRKNGTKIKWIHNNETGVSNSIKECACEHDLKTSGIHKVLNGEMKHHHNYTFIKI